jgi:hypothetical protein
MLGLFRRYLLPTALVLLLAMGASACVPICEREIGRNVEFEPSEYREASNTWIDNPKMAAVLMGHLERLGRNGLVIRYGFNCSPKADKDCPDCQVCTLSLAGVIAYDCKPDGDLFIKAEVGPGTNVRAMTYWRR